MAETENIYVRQDVFDAKMDRLETIIQKNNAELNARIDRIKILIEKNGTELKAYVDNAVNEVKAEIQYVGNEVKLLNARVNSVESVFYRRVGFLGIIMLSAVLFLILASHMKKLLRPSVTIEDVERMINSAISKLEAKQS